MITIEVYDASDSVNMQGDNSSFIGTVPITIDRVLSTKLLGERYNQAKTIRLEPHRHQSVSSLMSSQKSNASQAKLNLEVDLVGMTVFKDRVDALRDRKLKHLQISYETSLNQLKQLYSTLENAVESITNLTVDSNGLVFAKSFFPLP